MFINLESEKIRYQHLISDWKFQQNRAILKQICQEFPQFQLPTRTFILYTVVILINATTLMHKSTLNTNNFGNNHFGQKYQKQNLRL